MKRSQKPTRVRTPDGDWYVATSDKDWAEAFARQQQACLERRKRMEDWEKEHHPTDSNGKRTYPGAAYWDAYKAEKYRIPIDWPIPTKHVLFQRGALA